MNSDKESLSFGRYLQAIRLEKKISLEKVSAQTRIGLGNLLLIEQEDYEGLPHNSIFDIFEDRQGGIWIGTWSGGVAYLHHSDNKFSNYRHSKEPGAISDNMVSSFAQLTNGDLFVGTELFGLNKFDPGSANFTQINIHKTKSKNLCKIL